MKKTYQSSARFKTPEYRAWANMKSRCYDPNREDWKYYAAKGIVVCERWINSFEDFLRDVGQRPSELHSLDRYPNREGNYEPGNVRWATAGEQSANRTTNWSIGNEKLTLAELCRNKGLDYLLVFKRLKRGHPIEIAIRPGRMKRSCQVNTKPPIQKLTQGATAA